MRYRLARPLAAAAAILCATTLAAPAPSAAQSQQFPPFEGDEVWPGLARDARIVGLQDDSRAVAYILHWDVDDPDLALRMELGHGTLAGLENIPDMGTRLLPEGAVAGINGGFWHQLPTGEPNGYYAVDGELISEAESQGEGPRGMFGITPDGEVLMTRVASELTLGLPGGDDLNVDGLNRFKRSAADPFPDGDDVVLTYTHWIGATVAVPADPRPQADEPDVTPARVVVIDGLTPPSTGIAAGTVTEVSDGGGTTAVVPEGATVVVAQGSGADALGDVAVGDTVTLDVHLEPFFQADDEARWNTIVTGLAAGPLVVHQGGPVPPGNWASEGFSPEVHSNARAPRSAIAITEDGRMLLITVDGRQPGYSAGMTMAELTGWLLSIGAVQALALDGGASSQMAIDGLRQNSPCCDRGVRPVANGLFVQHDYTFTGTDRLMGGSREATAAAIAEASHPSGATEVVLANGGGFPDALAGGPLARSVDAPLLLTNTDAVPPVTSAALDRLAPRTVTLLGGTSVISQAVEDELAATYAVRRIAGRDRTETAAAAAALFGTSHPRAFLASADNFPDALSASAPAGILGMPILLTRRDDLPAATRDALLAAGTVEVVVVGGTGVISPAVVDALDTLGISVTRLAGDTRYGTMQAVNTWAVAEDPGIDSSGLVVASGGGFPDALAGGPLAAKRNQLLALVPRPSVFGDPDGATYLRSLGGLQHITLLGGFAALSSFQQWELDRLVAELSAAPTLPTPTPTPTDMPTAPTASPSPTRSPTIAPPTSPDAVPPGSTLAVPGARAPAPQPQPQPTPTPAASGSGGP